MGCMLRLWPVTWALLINGLCSEQPTGPVKILRCGFSEGIYVVSNSQGLKDLVYLKRTLIYIIFFFFRANKVVGNRKLPKRKLCEREKTE